MIKKIKIGAKFEQIDLVDWRELNELTFRIVYIHLPYIDITLYGCAELSL